MTDASPPRRNSIVAPPGSGFDKQFKIIIIGDSGTGKTSLLMRIGDGKAKVNTEPTVGVDMRNKTFLYGEDQLRVKL